MERDEIYPDDNDEDEDLLDEEDDFTLVRPEAIEEFERPAVTSAECEWKYHINVWIYGFICFLNFR